MHLNELIRDKRMELDTQSVLANLLIQALLPQMSYDLKTLMEAETVWKMNDDVIRQLKRGPWGLFE